MVPCLACLCRYTGVVHRPSSFSLFPLQDDSRQNKQHGKSIITGLTFEAPISVQRIPPTFTIYYFIHVLYCINSPRVPLPYRSRLSTSDQRLPFDPLSIRFHGLFHHHDTTPIATSPMLILRAMLDTSAHQRYFATTIFTTGHRSAINNIAFYFLENFYMHSQNLSFVTFVHLIFYEEPPFFGLVNRSLA